MLSEQEKYKKIFNIIRNKRPKYQTIQDIMPYAVMITNETKILFPNLQVGYYFGRDEKITDITDLAFNPYTDTFYFLKNKQVHREDGPAQISFRLVKIDYYYNLFGSVVSENDFWNHPLAIKATINSIINL